MTVSLLSLDFLAFSAFAVGLVSLSRGGFRELAFLSLNIAFVWYLLGAVGLASTIAFCLLGYALIKLNVRFEQATLLNTLPLFVALFIYMQNYEIVRWFLPDGILTGMLRTVGLSFLLFRIIHVLIDAKSRTLDRLSFLSYLNFCLNFTTFLIGPILRYQDYRDQWRGEKQAIPTA